MTTKIEKYLDELEGVGKRHVLLIATPKDEYPDHILDNKFYKLEQSVLMKPRAYIGIYEDDDEIMQYVAFRLFLSPVICDKYSLRSMTTTKIRRLSEREIINFFVIRHFYNTVPYGEKKEEEAINDGKTEGKEFLKKYPIDKFEHTSVNVGKDSDEANVLIKLKFENKNNDYYFDYVYVR